jgi:hypothetical protein
MAVSGTNTNYVKMTASGDLFPATAKDIGGNWTSAPSDYAGLNMAGIVIRKDSGVIGNITLQAGYLSGTTMAYVDILPQTKIATNTAWCDFWHMPEGGGAMSPRQIKATLLSNMSVVLWKR